MSSLFHVLLWFVASCSCVCTLTMDRVWLRSPDWLLRLSWWTAFLLSQQSLHMKKMCFSVWRESGFDSFAGPVKSLFHLVSKWIKICELKLCLFCLSVNLYVDAPVPNAVNVLCLYRSFLTFDLSTSLHSLTRTQVTKTSSGIFKKNESPASYRCFLEPWTLLGWASVFGVGGWRLLKLKTI